MPLLLFDGKACELAEGCGQRHLIWDSKRGTNKRLEKAGSYPRKYRSNNMALGESAQINPLWFYVQLFLARNNVVWFFFRPPLIRALCVARRNVAYENGLLFAK